MKTRLGSVVSDSGPLGVTMKIRRDEEKRKAAARRGGALAVTPKARGSAARSGGAITQNRVFIAGGSGRGNVASGTGGENSRAGTGKRAASVQSAAPQAVATSRDARRAEKIRAVAANSTNRGERQAAKAALQRMAG